MNDRERPDTPRQRELTPTADPPLPHEIVVDAIFQDGVIKLLEPLDLPPDTLLQLHIATTVTVVVTPENERVYASEAAPPLVSQRSVQTPPWLTTLQSGLQRGVSRLAALRHFEWMLFAIGLLIYATTRLVSLKHFPIYFFSDEAIQSELADRLLRNGFRDQTGTFLPPYFLNSFYWNLSLSVYVHLISVIMFGKSMIVTRATSAVVSMLSAVAVALTLKLIFKQRFWWLGPLIVALIPAWFLHSRTAFETVMMVSFYACFLCSYLLYRYKSPDYLYLALICGAATFYSYANGQGLMLFTGLFLLVSDLRYHMSQRHNYRLLLGATALAVLLASPYLRFRSLHPDAMLDQLNRLDSYWVRQIPLSEKLSIFGTTYLQSLSPTYWFLPNDIDLVRHRMKDMGHIPIEFLPFLLLGLGICLRRWRSSAHRALLIALFAAPFSGALAGLAITRTLAMIVPAALLTCLGLEQVYSWARQRVNYKLTALASCVVLSLMSLSLLRSALVDGPTWFTDYGLGGMQYGAEQLFTLIPQKLQQSSDGRVFLTPSWSNGTDVYPDFFLNSEQKKRVKLGDIDSFLFEKLEIRPDDLFVMLPDQYQSVLTSNKIVAQPPDDVLFYPDGQPGFYFVHLNYVDNVDAIFAAEKAERQKPVVEETTVNGEVMTINHSPLDIGQMSDLFDNDSFSLIRGLEANPFVLEFHFANPRSMSTLGLDLGISTFDLKLEATPVSGGAPAVFTQTYASLPPDPKIEIALPGGIQQVQTLRIEIKDTRAAEGATTHIHVRGVQFR